jgi:hypothetical protein
MNERIAEIWFSCFCWASENFNVIPAALADDWIDLVFAVRQPLSEPTCEKPRTIVAAARWLPVGLLAAVPVSMEAVRRAAAASAVVNVFIDTYEPPSVRMPSCDRGLVARC